MLTRIIWSNIKQFLSVSLVQRHVWFYTSFQQHVPTAAQNVINMYNLIWPPPLVVLDLVNKQEIAATPYVLEAARRLSRKGFKVIVDACEGTLIPDESGFSRARIIYLGYMDWGHASIDRRPSFYMFLLHFTLTSLVSFCCLHFKRRMFLSRFSRFRSLETFFKQLKNTS